MIPICEAGNNFEYKYIWNTPIYVLLYVLLLAMHERNLCDIR